METDQEHAVSVATKVVRAAALCISVSITQQFAVLAITEVHWTNRKSSINCSLSYQGSSAANLERSPTGSLADWSFINQCWMLSCWIAARFRLSLPANQRDPEHFEPSIAEH